MSITEKDFELDIDGSYSGVVDIIQGDIDAGREFIVKCINDFYSLESEIDTLEITLEALKTRQNLTQIAINKALDHLKISKPVYVDKTKVGLVYVVDNNLIANNKIL